MFFSSFFKKKFSLLLSEYRLCTPTDRSVITFFPYFRVGLHPWQHREASRRKSWPLSSLVCHRFPCNDWTCPKNRFRDCLLRWVGRSSDKYFPPQTTDSGKVCVFAFRNRCLIFKALVLVFCFQSFWLKRFSNQTLSVNNLDFVHKKQTHVRACICREELVDKYHYPPLLSYLETLPLWYGIDEEDIVKHLSEDGSMFQSPSATVCAFITTRNRKCMNYLQALVQRFPHGG